MFSNIFENINCCVIISMHLHLDEFNIDGEHLHPPSTSQESLKCRWDAGQQCSVFQSSRLQPPRQSSCLLWISHPPTPPPPSTLHLCRRRTQSPPNHQSALHHSDDPPGHQLHYRGGQISSTLLSRHRYRHSSLIYCLRAFRQLKAWAHSGPAKRFQFWKALECKSKHLYSSTAHWLCIIMRRPSRFFSGHRRCALTYYREAKLWLKNPFVLARVLKPNQMKLN